MLDAAREAAQFVKGRARADLETDRKLSLALIQLLLVLGEAAKAISPEFRQSHPQIAWKEALAADKEIWLPRLEEAGLVILPGPSARKGTHFRLIEPEIKTHRTLLKELFTACYKEQQE